MSTPSLFLSMNRLPASFKPWMREWTARYQLISRIILRTQRVVGTRVDFNEVLSVLYREGQKMSWHDDGEPGESSLSREMLTTGLGSIVAGLSLGSFAVISWRRKSAHCNINAAFNTGMPDPRKEATPPIALSLTTSHGVSLLSLVCTRLTGRILS